MTRNNGLKTTFLDGLNSIFFMNCPPAYMIKSDTKTVMYKLRQDWAKIGADFKKVIEREKQKPTNRKTEPRSEPAAA